MAAQPLADSQPQTPIPDNRRITEHAPAVVALKAKTVRKLQASVNRLLRDLRPGSGVPQGEAQSQFIQRHVGILRAAYSEAHRLGQRQYYDGVSRDAAKWAREEPDQARMARTLAFYAPSVAKIAHEAAIYAAAARVQQSIPDASHVAALSDGLLSDAQGHSERSVRLADRPAVTHTGVMVAFMITGGAAKALAQPDGEPIEDLHITLAFLGDSSDLDETKRRQLVQAVATYAATAKPLRGSVSGVGRFNPSPSSEGKVPVIAMVNVLGIQQWRAGLAEVLEEIGTPAAADFEYTPHITLAYVDEDKPLPDITVRNVALRLNRVTVAIGDDRYTFPIGKPLAQSYTFAETADPTDAYAEWQQGLGARIMLQADLTWSGAQDGYVAAGWGDSANPYSSLWWNLEPIAQHCSDCPVFAAGSPYDPPWVDGGNILHATPGDGNTECGAACRCDLSYGGSLGYTRTQDWKAWLPQNMPDAPDGPMEPVQPPAGKQPPAPPPEPSEEQPSRVPPSPFELPEGVRRSPYGPIIPGGEFTDGQKAALDLYRLAELEWNAVRGQLPELPNFFTLANPNFSWPRLKWEELTKAQQKALSLALEAWFRWSAALPEGWQDYYDEDPYAFADDDESDTYKLFNPNHDSRGRFTYGSGSPAHGSGRMGSRQAEGAGHVAEHVGGGHHASGSSGGGGGKADSEELRKAQDHLAAIRRTRNDPTQRSDDSPAALERLGKARERVAKLESLHPDAPRFEERFDMHGNPRAHVISRSAPAETIRPFPTSRGHVTGQTEVEERAHEALEHTFGRRLSDDEVRSMVGAQSGDDVYVTHGSEQSVHFKLDGQHYEAERTFNGVVMHNDIFRVEEGAQGQGLGTRIFADQVRGLNALGVVRIDTFAARIEGQFNGYYTWPRLGYNAAVHLPSIYLDYPREIAGEDGWTDLHTLMRTPEGREWWHEHGDPMSMSFDTTTGSRSMQALDAYLRARGMGGL